MVSTNKVSAYLNKHLANIFTFVLIFVISVFYSLFSSIILG